MRRRVSSDAAAECGPLVHGAPGGAVLGLADSKRVAIRKGETRIFGAASGRELEETHRTASVEGDVGEVVQVAQRIRGVEEAHQRECVRLAQLGCTPQPVQAPRDVALARALVSEQVHRTDSAIASRSPAAASLTMVAVIPITSSVQLSGSSLARLCAVSRQLCQPPSRPVSTWNVTEGLSTV